MPGNTERKMNEMKERFRRFMQGRYGFDEFARFTLGAALVALILSMFIRGWLGSLLNTAALLLLVYTYYRALSRDFSRRYAENQRYLEKSGEIRRRFDREKNIMKQRKDYHIYSCPGCSQKIRIPRGKGQIEITCPKCGYKFVKRS